MERIVCGVDGSPGSQHALAWAVDEARRRTAVLRVVHGWEMPPMAYPFVASATAEAEAIEEVASIVMAEAVAQVHAAGPDIEVEELVVHGSAAFVLLEAAEKADLLVVGSRGRGGFAGLLLGSVSQQVVHHAACPVVVVPSPPS